jgi:HAD superfamily hydrolase (TIGR01549 family)
MFPKVILLDFDGVIVESVGIKDQAFQKLFQGYIQYLPQIMEYHLSHNATIRFTKFHYITEQILKEPYDEQKEKALSRKFSDLVFENIVQCPFVEGAIKFLEYFSNRVPLYLISMSPEDELSKILEKRGLQKYFQNVYANPTAKSEVFQHIISQKKFSPKDAVYIGDSSEDYQAAEAIGIPFIGRKSGKEFPKGSFPVFNNLDEIRAFLITER